MYSDEHQTRRQEAASNDLFSQVANVAQVKPDHLDHREEDHPSYEQSLVVSWKIMELERKHTQLPEVKEGDLRSAHASFRWWDGG